MYTIGNTCIKGSLSKVLHLFGLIRYLVINIMYLYFDYYFPYFILTAIGVEILISIGFF